MDIICAVDENSAFGNNGKLPWVCKRDLKHFAYVTNGCVLIMGRNTWESLPKTKILATRKCIVVTSRVLSDERITCCRNITDAFHYAKQTGLYAFVIGGPRLMEEALLLNLVKKIHLTVIRGQHLCDTRFETLHKLLHNFVVDGCVVYKECTFMLYSHIHLYT